MDNQSQYPLEEEHPEEDAPEGSEEKRPSSRLDRLMSAKDRAEKEAERWSEIEEKGTPVPSHDQDYGVTQPVIPEPPRKAGDTPTGRDTPPEGLPAIKKSDLSSGPAVPADRRATGSRLPHPTDNLGSGAFAEPPVPDNLDQGPGVHPRGGQPHQAYQPPPTNLEQVRLDKDGMPLPPRRVPREDPDATMAGRSSYSDDVFRAADPTQPHGYERPSFEETRPSIPQEPPPPPQPINQGMAQTSYPQSGGTGRARLPQQQPSAPPRQPARPKRRQTTFAGTRLSWGCLARTALLTFIGGLVALMLTGGGAAVYYAQVTAPSFQGINDISDLQARALQFETTRIRDREGSVLYEINDPNGGLRDYVTLDEISPWVIMATVSTEERDFFVNPGFSIPGIIRAVVQNYREGEVVSGASTITQQLTRALLLPEEERYERSYSRKIKEIFLAAELGRRFSKRDILELYLNQAFYGNFAYGIEAAAQTYFGKSARDLTLAEASFLAGLPQAPAIWDPVTSKEDALTRQQQVLGLMLEAGCLETGNTDIQIPCMTQAELTTAQPDIASIAAQEFQSPNFQAKYPHWVVYIQQQLEADPAIGPAIYTSGFDVYTTLDPRLQDLAQGQVELALSGLTDRNVTNASVVIIDPHTGAILAMVGSRDFNNDAINGQVNVALTLQQPGSSIKPFTYLTAFRNGWTPSTVLWDVPISYEIPGFGVYEPVNYDGKFRGPVSVRTAIANSLNVPAIQTLDHVGVAQLLQTLNDVGVTSLGTPDDASNYGLSLTLGAGEVYLVEWTNAFATIANGGTYRPLYAIDRIERNGQILEGYPYQVPEGRQAIDPALDYLLRDIISDKEARIPSFGRDSVLSPPYPAGAKTGTTNDFRDNWTMGFTTEMAVGVWVGNTDNSPMINVSGVTGAGPIWRGIMDGAQQWYPAQAFAQPQGIFQQTVCVDDGGIPSQYCQEHSEVYTGIFANNYPPPDAESGLYRELLINPFTGLVANDFCPTDAKKQLYLFLPNPSQLIDISVQERNWLLNTPEGQAWATQRGIPPDQIQTQPPTQACGADTQIPEISINDPAPNSSHSGILIITGTADAPNFSHYYVDFGLGPDPQGWGSLQGATQQAVHNGVLGQLDLAPFENGQMTIRVVVVDTSGHSAEKRVIFNVENPTETPNPTSTDKPPDTPTPTLAPTATEAPTETPEATAEP